MLSKDRFSNSTSTTWSIAFKRSGLIGRLLFQNSVNGTNSAIARSRPPASAARAQIDPEAKAQPGPKI